MSTTITVTYTTDAILATRDVALIQSSQTCGRDKHEVADVDFTANFSPALAAVGFRLGDLYGIEGNDARSRAVRQVRSVLAGHREHGALIKGGSTLNQLLACLDELAAILAKHPTADVSIH